MLYDPKWQQKQTADVYSKEGLIAWLENFPPHTSYNYCRKKTCLIAQYLQARGVKKYELYSHEIEKLFGLEISQAVTFGSTFGDVLESLRTGRAN